MEYRDFMSLTDDEIIFIITDIFPYTKKVDNIVRDQKSRCISCDIYQNKGRIPLPLRQRDESL